MRDEQLDLNEYMESFVLDMNDGLEELDWSILELEKDPENEEVINRRI